MKRFLNLALALALAFPLTACIKGTTKLEVKADNTATVAFKFGLKTEALEKMKEMGAQFGGEEATEKMDEAFGEMNGLFDEKKITEKLKKGGLDVTKAVSSEKDGWKSIEIEGLVKDVNAWIANTKRDAEKSASGSPLEALGSSFTMTPAFYKTETEGVGQIVVIPPLGDLLSAMGDGENPLSQIEDLDDETREMIEGQIDMVKSMFSLDEMVMEFTLKVPGNIVSQKGCKKVDDQTLAFNLRGAEFTFDSIKTMMGLKDGVSATFQIPADCKLNFEDAPKKGQKAGTTPTPAGDEDEKKGKKGGLKIGEEKKG